MLRPTVGWLERNWRAAAAKLWVSATATKVLQRSQSIGVLAPRRLPAVHFVKTVRSILNSHPAPVQPYNGPIRFAETNRFLQAISQTRSGPRPIRRLRGLALRRDEMNAVTRFACRHARTPRRGLAALHRVGPRAGHRPVQGRRGRLVPGAQCAPGRKARGMADPHRERARRIQGAASGEEGRALRGQPDLPRLQRPADAGHGNLRQAQGADHHHLAAAAAGDRRGSAFLWRRRVP